MHNGSFSTLYQVIDFYDKGGNPNPNLEMHLLHLTLAEKQELLAFLKALSGTVRYGVPKPVGRF